MAVAAKQVRRFRDNIDGVALDRELGRGAHSVVYAGTCEGKPVAVKVCHPKALGEDLEKEAAAFTREAATLARIRARGLVRMLAVGRTAEARPYMIMEHIEGQTLAVRLGAGGPLDEAEVVQLGIALADTLQNVHERGVVHRDLKPANIIIEAHGGAPKIIDFGLATDTEATPGQDGASAESAEVAGTFAYSPPEQTGMLNTAVDGRSDLYSLGAVLFECATGEPPFHADDVGALLKLHATQPAPGVRERRESLSRGLERVIAQLLAKDPDDRYDSAFALSADLRRLQASALDEHSLLNCTDVPPWRAFDTVLAGRDAELDVLSAMLAQCAAGSSAVAAVVAPGGHGKTRLCQELARRAHAQQELVLWARCVDGPQGPLAPLISGIEHILSDADVDAAHREHWTESIQTAAGDRAPILRKLIPSLSAWLPESEGSDVGDLEADGLAEAAASFVVGLARDRGAMLLVVDDAQWIDSASRRVLQHLAGMNEDAPILITWASRESDERCSLPSVARTLELAPLPAKEASRMVAARLGCNGVEASVYDHIERATGGVPRAIDEYLRALVDGGALLPHWGAWKLDEVRLRELQLPGSLGELVAQRAVSLQPAQREVMELAALVGRRFNAATLEDLLEDERRVHEVLSDALRAGLLEVLREDEYGFVHDEARAALLDCVDEAERPVLHRRIAATEDARATQHQDSEALVQAARHYMAGHDESVAERAYHVNVRAGKDALERLANAEALELLQNAHNIAATYELETSADLHAALGEAHAQGGDFSRAVELYVEGLKRTDDPIAQAQMHNRVCDFHMWTGFDIASMKPHLESAWDCLGMRIPTGKLRPLLLAMWHTLLAVLRYLTGYGMGRDEGKPVAEARWKALLAGAANAYVSGDVPMMVYMLSRQVEAGQFAGRTRARIDAWGAYGSAIDTFRLPARLSERFFRAAHELADELDDSVARVRLMYWRGTALNHRGRPMEAQQLLSDALFKHSWCLPLDMQVAIAIELSSVWMVGGHAKRCLAMFERLENRRVGNADQRTRLLRPMLYSAHCLLGNASELDRLEAAARQDLEEASGDNPMLQIILSGFSMMRVQEEGRLATLDEHIDATDMGVPASMAPWQLGIYFARRGHARYLQWCQAQGDEKGQRVQQLEQAVKDVTYFKGHQLYQPDVALLSAMAAHVHGDLDRADQLAGEAERRSRRIDHPLGEMEALRFRAQLLWDAGLFEPAGRVAKAAIVVAAEHGWVHRERRLRSDFGLPDTQQMTVQHSRTSSTTRSATRADMHRKALMEVSLRTAREVDVDAQAVVALDELIGLLGAERAVLLLVDQESGQLVRAAARDAEGEDLGEDAVIAMTIVDRVRDSLQPLVLSGTQDGAALGSESVVANDLRSMICAPLLLGDRLMGIIYLDSRLAKGVFTSADVDILSAITGQIVVAREAALSAQRQLQARELEKDLQLTAAVQHLLLPADRELANQSFELAAHYEPAGQAGGDFWHCDEAEDGTLRVWLGDVTGHGAGPAMVTAVLAGCYRALQGGTERLSTVQIMAEMHRVLSMSCGGRYNMPLAVLELHPDGTGCYYSAAAPPLLLTLPDGRTAVEQSPGTPLGSHALQIGTCDLQLKSGTQLLLTTDGPLEMQMENGGEYGLRRLSKHFKSFASTDAAEARDALARKLAEVRGTREADDDLTFVTVCVK